MKRTTWWGLVAMTVGASAVWLGCSSNDAKKSTPAADDNDICSGSNCNQGKKKSNADSAQQQQSPTTAPDSGAPAATVADAGKPDANKPPPPQNCGQLSTCCGTLSDFGDKLTCIGVAVADNDSACQVALAVCKAGGVGIGGAVKGAFGGSNDAACTNLAGCCDELYQAGYDTTTCVSVVEGGSSSSCQSSLDRYVSFGDCTAP